MDKLYMVILLLTIIPILICIKYARKVKSDVADSITRCLFFVTNHDNWQYRICFFAVSAGGIFYGKCLFVFL